MILSDLVCFFSLDTGQENYDLGDCSFTVRQNIEMTLIKLKVGKRQATNTSRLLYQENSMRLMS